MLPRYELFNISNLLLIVLVTLPPHSIHDFFFPTGKFQSRNNELIVVLVLGTRFVAIVPWSVIAQCHAPNIGPSIIHVFHLRIL